MLFVEQPQASMILHKRFFACEYKQEQDITQQSFTSSNWMQIKSCISKFSLPVTVDYCFSKRLRLDL